LKTAEGEKFKGDLANRNEQIDEFTPMFTRAESFEE
jgi:hypothetical protein